ncbi:MAG: hypothetical protein IH609_09640 [Dehalococcoidia bacterium]|nr:hypothetical protein [Dehalococcoidia bacterium]
MTARQPRRPRRRLTAPAAALPRPVTGMDADQQAERSRELRRAPAHHREHHVTRDYGHVKKDLLTILVVGIGVVGFIFGMSFYVQHYPW